MQFGTPTKAYSPTVRKFCFTLSYYSPKAYSFLRETFNLNLPSQRTLRSWYSAIETSPNFTNASFDALKQKADLKKENGEKMLVGLMLDGMHIRQHCQWDKNSKKFLGLNMMREQENETNLPLASNALVLMVSGLHEDFKLPIGYFLNNGSNQNEIADVVDQAMFRLNAAGCTLASITYDGAKENIAFGKLMGATLENPYIRNPYDETNKVYLVLDPPHMLKLIRNCLANKGILYDQNGGEIKWDLIQSLVTLQLNENVNFGNKLTKTHIEYQDKKMHVRLAAETISRSTANSLKFLDSVMKNPNIANSSPTSEYLEVFDSLFDVMNSKHGHCNDKYKRPFSENTKSDFNELFEKAKSYIKGLQIMENGEKKSILQSRSFTPFFGFLQNIESFKCIYNDYGLGEFYAFRICQDLLEKFFGCISRMNGCNDNPTEQQFCAAYKKLLFQNAITSSEYSNCQNALTKILFVPSGNKVKANKDIRPEIEMLKDYDFLNTDVVTQNITALKSHAMAYMASIVETRVVQKIVRRGQNCCLKCVEVFLENEITDDDFIEFQAEHSQMYQPCQSTFQVINDIEKHLQKYQGVQVSFEASMQHILKNIDISSYYPNSEFDDDHDASHKMDLIRLIAEAFLDGSSTDGSKILTTETKVSLVRHKRLKEIHRLGQ